MTGPLDPRFPFRATVLVVSDRSATGTHVDESGPAAKETLEAWGAEKVAVEVIPDDPAAIRDRLCGLCDRDRVDLVLTSGGTGLAPRDVTPETTREVVDRDAPGIAELLRRESSRFTPFASLSRGVSGIRGGTLIINLPGSPRGVVQCLGILKPILPHALIQLRGRADGHPPRTPRPPEKRASGPA